MTRPKKSKYPGQDIALDSANVNEAIRLLPKGHEWSSVRIQTTSGNLAYGNAVCIICNAKIAYSNYHHWFLLNYFDFNVKQCDIKSCDEYKMMEALD